MKARIKATGKVVEVIPVWTSGSSAQQYQVYGRAEFLSDDQVEILNEATLVPPQEQYEHYCKTLINWEEREWGAAVAIMAAMLSNEELRAAMLHDRANCAPKLTIEEYNASMAIEQAKALVAEYRKGE